MRPARPYFRDKIASVFSFAEITLFLSLFINVIPVFHLHSCVDNGNKMYLPGFHFIHKGFEVREFFLIHRKIHIVVHVVDIHIEHVHGNVIVPVFLYHIPEIIRSFVTPAALSETESEFRRDIAYADDLPELLHDIIRALPVYHIEIQIRVPAADFQFILSGIADIKLHDSRIIQKQAESLFTEDNYKIMSPVKRIFALCVIGLVGAVADVTISSFIDPSVRLSQAVDDIVRIHFITENKLSVRFDFSVGRNSL